MNSKFGCFKCSLCVLLLVGNAWGQFKLKVSDHERFTQRDLMNLILPLKPGKSTLFQLRQNLPTPDVQTKMDGKMIWGFRLNSPPGSDVYDIFLTFKNGMLIQVERPLVDIDFSREKMEKMYGLPDKIELRPPTNGLPSRTLYFFPKRGLTFVQDKGSPVLTGLIHYKESLGMQAVRP